MATWNPITKPSGTTYTRLGNPKGKQIYDDPNITYDSSSVYYDSTDVSEWTKIGSPLINVTWNSESGTWDGTNVEWANSIWTGINKAT